LERFWVELLVCWGLIWGFIERTWRICLPLLPHNTRGTLHRAVWLQRAGHQVYRDHQLDCVVQRLRSEVCRNEIRVNRTSRLLCLLPKSSSHLRSTTLTAPCLYNRKFYSPNNNCNLSFQVRLKGHTQFSAPATRRRRQATEE
jgi:hypothetical protein